MASFFAHDDPVARARGRPSQEVHSLRLGMARMAQRLMALVEAHGQPVLRGVAWLHPTGANSSVKQPTDKAVRDALPTVTCHATRLESVKGTADATCVLCCEDYAVGDTVVELPCGHTFHKGTEEPTTSDACNGILYWLSSNKDCPLCRASL